jgi:hypothetical protein
MQAEVRKIMVVKPLRVVAGLACIKGQAFGQELVEKAIEQTDG